MITRNDSLVEWERAEIVRSGVQARLSGDRVKPTRPDIFARYRRPSRETAYPWEYAFHLLGDTHGQRILDLGCGDGECTTLIASHGGTIAALDISTDLLALAKRRSTLDGSGSRVKPFCASAHSIPLANESVDVVFGMAVLHHVDLALTAREVHRVLVPGGRAIFAEPIRNSRMLAAVRAAIPYRQPDISPFERPLRMDEIRGFVAGFRSWHHRKFELPFVQLARVCNVSSSLQSWAYQADVQLLRRFPRLGHFASVMVFQVYK